LLFASLAFIRVLASYVMQKSKSPCILYLSSFPPRQCGIATFTKHLTEAIDKEFAPELKSKIMAINDNGTSIYLYPKKVALQLQETHLSDYIKLANEINRSPEIKLVNIQHEYGLFGGDWGEYLLMFLELVKKPIVMTCHTVLPNPKEKVVTLTREIAEKTNGIIVMTHTAARLLVNKYHIPKNKISVIPHGVDHIAFPSKSRAKKKVGMSGKIVLSTFGMLNRDKGIEYAIEALPELVIKYPNLIYLVLGATHPVVRKQEGEKYRKLLKRTVKKYKLEEHVKFYDMYLTDEEKIDFLKATDIYISPTLNPKQSVSGTISEALSCACPIIATANQYAKDVINPERGILVDFRNSSQIKEALLKILDDKKMREEMKKNSYFYSRHMTWQNVALSYFQNFNKHAKIVPRRQDKLPPINLSHIRTLTNNEGMIQFANHTKPDAHSGYCVDDNTRALLGMATYYDMKPNQAAMNLINIYFKFLKTAQKSNGKFYNFIGYHKNHSNLGESEDSYGRALWALGYLVYSPGMPDSLKKAAQSMLNRSLKWATELESLRAISFTILGLYFLSHKAATFENKNELEKYKIIIRKLADKLLKKYQKHTAKQPGDKIVWHWFEDFLTYSNFKLPEALYRAFQITKNKHYLQVAEESMKFLTDITIETDYFAPIGQDGWYFRNQERAYFDQQPEDASSAVEGLIAAFEATGKKHYTTEALLCFNWFLGKNYLNQMLYDEATGGCYDGMGRYSINFNQGAESTISYFLARLAVERIK
jgi:glycosyltransferase involved in cell wall biosynthesis